ncbi:fibroblast growth factor 19 [Lissotriton helveticus]
MCWRRLLERSSCLALAQLCLALLLQARPLFDAGPHVSYEWDETIRVRHLLASRRHGQSSYFLRISEEGEVERVRSRSTHTLLEIRAVAANSVVLKSYQNSRYLCMDSDGKLRGQDSYSADDCSYEEKIQPDGYNVYTSKKHGMAVSLAKDRERWLCVGKCFFPLSHFLLLRNNEPLEIIEPVDEKFTSDIFPEENPLKDLQSMDIAFGFGHPSS